MRLNFSQSGRSAVRAVAVASALCYIKISHPFSTRSGRWLRADRAQLAARQHEFDFQKLCGKAVACIPGAHAITGCSKIEGGFNRAFILQTDNNRSVVVRVPFSVAGPPRLVTNSEVATLEYIRQNTSIPVPAVLDWNDDPQNLIGTEYIIQEHARGVQLHQRWTSMNTSEHLQAVQSLGRLAQKMSTIQFPAFGSVYFANAPVETQLIPLADGFGIGPHCGTKYWPSNIRDERSCFRRPPNRGPWQTHKEYCQGLIDVGHSRIPLSTPQGALEYKGSVDEHLQLNDVAGRTLMRLAEADELDRVSRPTLIHPDLHKRNIFVSDENPGEITALIDWQGSSVEPLHHYADEIPDLCEFPKPWNVLDGDAELTDEQRKTFKDVSICRRAWETIVQGWLPELHAARSLDQDLLRLFRYAPSAWRHGAVPIREDLMQLSKHWSVPLGLKGSCPYQPSPPEMKRHQSLWKEFELANGIQSDVIQGLGTDEDGWVPIDDWEETRRVHATIFRQWLTDVVAAGDITEQRARMIWPFDVPG